MITPGLLKTMALAGFLFPSVVTLRSIAGGKCAITGATRSGEIGTLTIDGGGAFAFSGNLDDMIAATMEVGRRTADGR